MNETEDSKVKKEIQIDNDFEMGEISFLDLWRLRNAKYHK